MTFLQQLFSSWNTPPIVTATGVVIVLGFPLISGEGLPLKFLQVLNVLAFLVNVIAVMVPGRIDSDQARRLQETDNDPTAEDGDDDEEPTEASRLVEPSENVPPRHTSNLSPMELRDRTLVRPAPWAFIVWGVIYLGEAVFVVAQFLPSLKHLQRSLPHASIPFVAANLLQSLWCASFRPSYDHQSWHRFVSCFMLGATAYALSHIPARDSWFYTPLAIHCGWTSAATLVNLNGSIAMDRDVPDLSLVAVGHSSVVLATVLGLGVTVFEVSTVTYGLTIAWALLAIASAVRLKEDEFDWSDALQSGARVQRALAYAGAVLCTTASIFTAALH